MKCNKCNRIIPDDSCFCAFCGCNINPSQAEAQNASQEENNKDYTALPKEKESEKISRNLLYCVITPLAFALLFFIAAAADVEYGFYTLVRILTLVFLGIFLFLYYLETQNFLNFPFISSLVVVILFNPLLPIPLDVDTWIVFDVLSMLTMIAISIYIYKIHIKSKK